MSPVELIRDVRARGGNLWAAGDRLELDVPRDFPDSILAQLKRAKPELLAYLQRRTELMDLPWPIGYAGLPAQEVSKAEACNDWLGITDPVHRRLNALMWMWQHYRDLGDLEMARQMREAYHELRHADSSIQALCGLCEYRYEGG